MKVEEIEVKKITGNPYQTRIFLEEEPLKILTKSIRERGLFNPITVLKKNKEEYIVVHGHRRLAAFKRLRRETIPSFVKLRKDRSSLITDLIHENLVREDLSVQEKALSIKLLFSQIKNIKDDLRQITSCITGVKLYKQRGPRKKEGSGAAGRGGVRWTDDDMFMAMKLLKTIGMSENNAISYLTVLKLPSRIQRIVSFNVHNRDREATSNRISIRMANCLARVDDEEFRDYLLERAFTGSTARHIDALVNHYILKVSMGEWEGFVRRRSNLKHIRGLNQELFIEIAIQCENLAKRVNSFKLTKLSALSETLERQTFIAAAEGLRKEMRLLDRQLKKRLKDKRWISVEKLPGNNVFEIEIKRHKARKTCRGSVPKRVLDRLDIKEGYVQLKIVGIRK